MEDTEYEDFDDSNEDTTTCQFCGEIFYPTFPGETVCPDCVESMTEDGE